MARDVALTGGLEARVADPLWLVSRQWQLRELRGEDAAQPAGIRVTGRSAPVTAVVGIAGDRHPLTGDRPLEAVVEAAPDPDFGAAGLHASVRAGRRLVRLLRDAGLGAAAAALTRAFPPAPPDRLVAMGSAGREAAALLARRGLDGAAVADASADALRTALAGPDAARALAIVASWREWYRRRGGAPGDLAWDDERLEYSFSVEVSGAGAPVALRAPAHDGGHLDWYSFDVAPAPAPAAGQPRGAAAERTVTALPAPVRYRGMPASRWWEFEDASVDFGDVEAGPADLARLLVAEFAVVYGSNWFVVPLRVPAGTLTEIVSVAVFDTFGGRSPVPSTAWADAGRAGPARRVWRLYELDGDELDDGHRAPWLFVPPALSGDVAGPALERLLLARDEGANLAWAVERLVEGPLGRAVDRAEAWHASRPAPPPPSSAAGAGAWRYRLESEEPPPWWIPLLPERLRAGTAEIRLRRARMRAWEQLDGGQVGPQGTLLDPRRPRWVQDEEVPRGGAVVERSWQLGRWQDGSLHVWLQRRKRPGRGERSSGLRWDPLLPAAGSPDAVSGD